MGEASELPPDPFVSFAGQVVQPDPARSRRLRVGVVLAAGRSERLASVTGGGSTALLRLGGLSLVERAVRSLLAAGLERVLVVADHVSRRWPRWRCVARLARTLTGRSAAG
jgi:CTP:molybdopterin cytidylyltransferase MocA